MTDRRRNTLILLIVAGLVAASLAAIVTKKTRLGLELKGGVELVYQGKPTAQSKVDTESLERAISIMRTRVDQLGVAQPEINRSGEKEIDVALPEVKNVHQAEAEVGKTAQLQFYDWETNVIGPSGQPTPTEGTVTGDTTSDGPGGVTAGLPEYQAVLRAAKRKPELRDTDTTAAGTCSTRPTKRCFAGRKKTNRASTRT
jgi:SecD/SecF fusion protein